MAYFIHLTKEQKGILKPKRTECPWEPGEREREVCDQHGLVHVCMSVSRRTEAEE